MTWEYKVNAVQPWVVASSGTKIYVLQYVDGFGGDDIYEYDPSTNDWTLIMDLSAVDVDASEVDGMVWFGGSLYFMVEDSSVDEFRVYRWNGTPNDVTEVTTLAPGLGQFGRLVTDGSVMIAYAINYSSSPGSVVKYTANGSTWSNGSFSTYTPREPSNNPWADIPPDAGYAQGIYVQCSTDHSGADSTRDTLFIWNTNTFTPITEYSWYTYLGGDPVTTDLLWTYSPSYYSTDFLENRTAATGNATTHCRQINMPYQPGLGIEITYTALYQYDGAGAFDYVEDFAPGSGGWTLGNDLDAWIVRLTNGMTYILDTESGTYSGAYVILERSDPISPPSTVSGLRYLRLAADSAYLYYTGIENGTISAWHRALADLSPAGTGTFGTTDFASPDNQTAGLYPVTRPGADGAIYVFGRDGNNKQVYFNDLNGTLGWQDIGAGIATWTTTKFCTALLPDVLNPPDVIVAFSDGDIYRTDDNSGTGNWVLMGTAAAGTIPVGLRQAGLRYALAGNEAMMAGTAAGSIMYTPNYGVSWDEVGGTMIGTINWFAESY